MYTHIYMYMHEDVYIVYDLCFLMVVLNGGLWFV